jgi:hypothetical protein
VIKAGIAFVADYIKRKFLWLHYWWNKEPAYQ